MHTVYTQTVNNSMQYALLIGLSFDHNSLYCVMENFQINFQKVSAFRGFETIYFQKLLDIFETFVNKRI